MGLLKVATNETAYAKIGIMGFAGSGKSFTGAEIAIGLAKKRGCKSVAYFDSEKGSDFLIHRFKNNGIELMRHKGRAFADLITIIDEAEKGGIPILIIDSVSHVWRDLCDSYQAKKRKPRLTMADWNILKGQWKDYTDRFLNSKLDILMLGRAGYEYDQEENEDGKKEIVKTGTKMKVEGETGFEPDLLLEMERVEEKDKIVNRCWVVKDRSNTMNGKSINYPTYESFRTFWEFVNFGGVHHGIDTTRNSQGLFSDPDWSYEERKKRTEIALEELQATLIKLGLDGTSDKAKRGRIELLESIFGTASRTAIENLPLDALVEGIGKVKARLEPEAPSAQEAKNEVPDDIRL